jgi:hypothetical protein
MVDEAEEGAEADTKDEHRRLRVREASAPPYKVQLKIPYSLGEEDADAQVDCKVTSNNPNPTLSTQLQIHTQTTQALPDTVRPHLFFIPDMARLASNSLPLALVFLVLDFSSS